MNIPAYLKDNNFTKKQISKLNHKCPKCEKGNLYYVPKYLEVCDNPKCDFQYNYMEEN